MKDFSFFKMSTAEFLEHVKKILPEWDITITPHDVMENPSKYDKAEITVCHKKNKIIKKAKFSIRRPLASQPPPYHFGILSVNIASLICKDTQNDDLELLQKISDSFSAFYEKD